MNYIRRAYQIKKLAKPGQVLVVYGARRSGKTTLIRQYLEELGTAEKYTFDSGDSISTRELLGSGDSRRLLDRVAGLSVYVVDEAQNIPNIGQALKILVDSCPALKIIATGSSSFDLAHKLGEPLVGRREVVTLYPFALSELVEHTSRQQVGDSLTQILTYGLYPQIYTAESNFERESKLLELVDGYLLKDIFTLENIQAPTQLLHVVKLLAQYVGQPISASKLANEVNLNKKTVERYLDLLEKTFVIHKVMPFSNKLSQSLKFKPKYYFYDVGIRNALIGNFLPPHERADIGGLWENFCFMERLKKHAYERRAHPRLYFYQSYETKKEIDIVEEYNGYTALECKWDYDRDTIALDEWDREYPSAPVSVVTRDTYMRYLL
jgi:predicted AAA+ superfamily ATPase